MMPKVVITVGPDKIERIQLRANSHREERASWRLYQCIRPVLEKLERALPKGHVPVKGLKMKTLRSGYVASVVSKSSGFGTKE